MRYDLAQEEFQRLKKEREEEIEKAIAERKAILAEREEQQKVEQ
jgi:hypothetical protein